VDLCRLRQRACAHSSRVSGKHGHTCLLE
jgi:hypothetical protein